ncbi:PREDICTED: probable cation transporter HKT6 [Ipomoea nil]|uniref:probable cation transporter HKT6 n=1 Tax=Ipomoea nil TaxID=35883 RepID=UPI000901A9EF|nr:PREDICTED: probable cation transporter HKT6 [Ipomoea nil]
MMSFNWYGKKLQHLCSGPTMKLCSCCRSTCFIVSSIYHSILFKINPILAQILYFILLSSFGFLILKALNPRTMFRPRNIDLFFTSVSAATVSSMSTVEMEVFSDGQLIVMTVLMFIGGEVFTSMVGLHLIRPKYRPWRSNSKVTSVSSNSNSPRHSRQSSFHDDQIELDIMSITEETPNPNHNESRLDIFYSSSSPKDSREMKYESIKFLGTIAAGYLLCVNVVGTILVLLYVRFVESAREVLRQKGLKLFTFSIFTVVSTFASCGFVPTNENMVVFSKNSGLLLILIPQILLGNTLYPVFLRLSIWFFAKFFKKQEGSFLLKHSREIGHLHLLPGLHSKYLVVTVLGFILVQFTLFCSLEWNSSSSSLGELNGFQKIVGFLFEVVNARHTGETIVDISTVAPAILVLFVVMMYLPPYTSFIPVKGEEQSQETQRKKKARRVDNIIFSQLSYLVIFIVLICITERERMKDDPLNFSVLSITLEVISAYGNVGFTMGYSCARMLKPDSNCKDKLYGLVGKWSDEGKIVLIFVMLFGRLKKFNMKGGKAWKLM